MNQPSTDTPRNRAERRHGVEYVNAEGLAAYWGVSRAHVYNMLAKGLPSITLGRARRFDLTAADQWAAGR